MRGAQRRGNPVAGAYRHCATSSRLPRCARNDKPKHPPSLRYPLSLRAASLLSLRGAQRRGNPVACAYVIALPHRDCHAALDKPRHPPSLRYPLSLPGASLLSLRGAQRRGNPDASAYCCSPYQSCARSRCSGFNQRYFSRTRPRFHLLLPRDGIFYIDAVLEINQVRQIVPGGERFGVYALLVFKHASLQVVGNADVQRCEPWVGHHVNVIPPVIFRARRTTTDLARHYLNIATSPRQ